MCLSRVLVTTTAPLEEHHYVWKVMRLTADGKLVFPYRNLGGTSWKQMFDEDNAIAETPAIMPHTWIKPDDPLALLDTGYRTGFHCMLTEKDAREQAKTVADDQELEYEDLVVIQVTVRGVRTVGIQNQMTVLVADEIYFNRIPKDSDRLSYDESELNS